MKIYAIWRSYRGVWRFRVVIASIFASQSFLPAAQVGSWVLCNGRPEFIKTIVKVDQDIMSHLDVAD